MRFKKVTLLEEWNSNVLYFFLKNIYNDQVEIYSMNASSVQFSSVQSFSHVRLFGTPWTAACHASRSINKSQSLLKLMSIELVMPSNHLILCSPLLLLPLIFPSIRIFSNESVSWRTECRFNIWKSINGIHHFNRLKKKKLCGHKSFCTAKESTDKPKDDLLNGKKIFANDVTYEGLIPNIYK